MNKRKKRNAKIKSWILVIAMLVSILQAIPGTNGAPQALAATQNDAVAWGNSQIGKAIDMDGFPVGQPYQCVDLIKAYYAYFGVGGYAMGNANEYAWNTLPPGWTRIYSGYQPGDVAVWKANHSCSSCNTGSYGHVGIITSADSVGFNAVNQNHIGQPYCTHNWFYISALECAIRPSYSSGNSGGGTTSDISVSFADFNQNAVSDTNAEVYIKVMNPNKANVTAVGCNLYNSTGTLLKSYTESCNYTTSYVNYNCNFNNDMKYTLSPGTTYRFELFAVVNGKEYKDQVRQFTTTGTIKTPTPSTATPIPPTPTPTQEPTPTLDVKQSPEPTPNLDFCQSPAPTPTKDGSQSAEPIYTPKITNTPTPTHGEVEDSEDEDDVEEEGDEIQEPEQVTGLYTFVSKKKMEVYWSWQTDVSGFQVQVARNKRFTKSVKTKNAGRWASKKIIKGLKRKKTYYVRVRAYVQTWDGKTYGEWSNTKKCKIK